MKRRLKTFDVQQTNDDTSQSELCKDKSSTAVNEEEIWDEPDMKKRKLNSKCSNKQKHDGNEKEETKKKKRRKSQSKKKKKERKESETGFDVYLHDAFGYPLSGYISSKTKGNSEKYSILTNEESNLLVFGYVRGMTGSQYMDIALVIEKYVKNDKFTFGGTHTDCKKYGYRTYSFIDVNGIDIITYSGRQKIERNGNKPNVKLSLKMLSCDCEGGDYGITVGLFGFDAKIAKKGNDEKYLTKDDFLNTMKPRCNSAGQVCRGGRSVMDQENMKEIGFDTSKHREWHELSFQFISYNSIMRGALQYSVDEYRECEKDKNKEGLLKDRCTLFWGKSSVDVIVNLTKQRVSYYAINSEIETENGKYKIHQAKLSSNMIYLFFVCVDISKCRNGMVYEINCSEVHNE